MKTTRVHGKNIQHKVLLYAISTCAWCRRAKSLLESSSIEFEYVYVDLSSEEDRKEIYKDIEKRGGRSAFPVIIVDDHILINGFHEDQIKEALGI
jgi:glutaredoxin-like protein NrdH